jgi:hypothetical protein
VVYERLEPQEGTKSQKLEKDQFVPFVPFCGYVAE